ncbi:DNA repair protein RecO [Aerococcaceae bacterium zg-BR22]|uniref:DNA repair protein RecO n=1 Tax=Aerococcaceae bacterium zg-1292 TaxID=2774330 RepID=UPI004062D0BD|nr:DNA repair protein RecO [Aerococcaceae bacterium zg-BR22]
MRVGGHVLERFEAVVLFKRPYRDHDLLVKLFTKDHGKRMFFIKNGRSATHALVAQIVPWSVNDYVGTLNESGFSFIREGSTVFFPRQLQSDLTLQAYASYFVQLTDAVIEDFLPDKVLFELLVSTLKRLNRADNPDVTMIYLELQLLPRFGAHLNWRYCLFTKRATGIFDFSIQQGGIIHESVFHEDRYRLNIHPRAIHFARILATHSLETIQTIDIAPETIQEMQRLVNELYQEYVGIRLKSKQYIEHLGDMDAKYQALLAQRKVKDTIEEELS